MTSFQSVYEAFLAKMTEDEWVAWTQEEVEADWRSILMAAIPRFKFPRVSLDISGDNFVGDLGNTEIQILAQYMKVEWLNRSILTWENIKPLYTERDFSPANMLDKLRQLLEIEKKDALEQERIYYRSINGKPWDYEKLGKN